MYATKFQQTATKVLGAAVAFLFAAGLIAALVTPNRSMASADVFGGPSSAGAASQAPASNGSALDSSSDGTGASTGAVTQQSTPRGATLATPAGASHSATSTVAAPTAKHGPVLTGHFTYATTGTRTVSGAMPGKPDAYPSTTSLDVTEQSGSYQLSRDMRDEYGSGELIDSSVVVRPEGVFLNTLNLAECEAGVKDELRFTAGSPAPLFVANAQPGKHVEFDMDGGATKAHMSVDYLGAEHVTVGRDSVPTQHIRVTTDFTGQVQGHSVSDYWMSTTHGFPAKEQVKANVRKGALSVANEWTAVLQDTRPGQ